MYGAFYLCQSEIYSTYYNIVHALKLVIDYQGSKYLFMMSVYALNKRLPILRYYSNLLDNRVGLNNRVRWKNAESFMILLTR